MVCILQVKLFQPSSISHFCINRMFGCISRVECFFRAFAEILLIFGVQRELKILSFR